MLTQSGTQFLPARFIGEIALDKKGGRFQSHLHITVGSVSIEYKRGL